MRILRTIYPNLTATNKHNLSTKLKFQMVIMFKQKKNTSTYRYLFQYSLSPSRLSQCKWLVIK